MGNIDSELKRLLLGSGAALVGFADISPFSSDFPNGVAIAAAISKPVLRSIADGPNADYLDEYNRLNAELDALAKLCTGFLRGRGYAALAQLSTNHDGADDRKMPIPHKSVATRAGLGWIGRSALLVTKEYGSGVRLTSVLTDAPLKTTEPCVVSGCGECAECVGKCPGKAIHGPLWSPDVEREVLLDAGRCARTARGLTYKNLGAEHTICGRCIAVCPRSKSYYMIGSGE